MNKKLTLFMIFGFVLTAFMIAQPVAADDQGWIEGTVTDEIFGEGLQGVTVTIVGTTVTATTDANGQFNVTVAVGSYDVKLTKTNYDETTKTGVSVSNATTTTISMYIETSKGNIVGTVTDKLTGDPVDYAWIQVKGDFLLPMGDFTGSDGRYEVLDIDVGSYTVNATKLGSYEVEEKTVVVKANQDVTLDFSIQPMEASLTVTVNVIKDIMNFKTVSGAKVTVNEIEKKTDSNGEAKFTGLDPGTYTITVKKSGFTSYEMDIPLNGGENTLPVTLVEKDIGHNVANFFWMTTFMVCILPIIIVVVVVIIIVVLLVKRKKSTGPPPVQPAMQQPYQQPPAQQPYQQQPPAQQYSPPPQPPGQQPYDPYAPPPQPPGQQPYDPYAPPPQPPGQQPPPQY